MRESGISNFRRALAGVMGAVVLVASLLPVFYMAAEADHDCTGDDCPICICLQQCESVFNQLGAGSVAQAPAVVFAAAFFAIALLSVQETTHETLISKKVRLNI